MMSEGDTEAPMWSYQVNLEKRVRDDHPFWVTGWTTRCPTMGQSTILNKYQKELRK
jgi:hypothetical protein